MAKAKKQKLPFDKRGGVLVLSAHLLTSPEYLALTANAKALIPQMQIHWRLEKPVDFGVREAAEKLGCSKDTASRVFKELAGAGFIKEAGESLFDSRYGSKTRSWYLTWMPYGTPDNPMPPTNDWEKQGRPVVDQPSDEKDATRRLRPMRRTPRKVSVR